MKAAVAGPGICLAPIASLIPMFRSGKLIEVLPEVVTALGGLFAVYPSRPHVPRAVVAFVEMVEARIATQGNELVLSRPPRVAANAAQIPTVCLPGVTEMGHRHVFGERLANDCSLRFVARGS
jgi:hypothetical protein